MIHCPANGPRSWKSGVPRMHWPARRSFCSRSIVRGARRSRGRRPLTRPSRSGAVQAPKFTVRSLTRTGSKTIGAIALLALGIACPVFAQKPVAAVLRVRSAGAMPLADNVAAAIVTVLRQLYDVRDFQDGTPDAVAAALARPRTDRLFVIGSPQSLAQIARI